MFYGIFYSDFILWFLTWNKLLLSSNVSTFNYILERLYFRFCAPSGLNDTKHSVVQFREIEQISCCLAGFSFSRPKNFIWAQSFKKSKYHNLHKILLQFHFWTKHLSFSSFCFMTTNLIFKLNFKFSFLLIKNFKWNITSQNLFWWKLRLGLA